MDREELIFSVSFTFSTGGHFGIGEDDAQLGVGTSKKLFCMTNMLVNRENINIKLLKILYFLIRILNDEHKKIRG